MITQKRCYITSTGSACATLAEAQLADLIELLSVIIATENSPISTTGSPAWTVGSLATGLMENREALVGILKLKERKPRGKGVRSTNGKPRKTRKVVPLGAPAPDSVPPVAA